METPNTESLVEYILNKGHEVTKIGPISFFSEKKNFDEDCFIITECSYGVLRGRRPRVDKNHWFLSSLPRSGSLISNPLSKMVAIEQEPDTCSLSFIKATFQLVFAYFRCCPYKPIL